MVVALSQIGPEHPETAAARELIAQLKVHVTRDERTPQGLRVLAGKIPERPVELLLDGDGRMLRGKCTCSHHFKGGLRMGPCRHLQALRAAAMGGQHAPSTLERWYERLWN